MSLPNSEGIRIMSDFSSEESFGKSCAPTSKRSFSLMISPFSALKNNAASSITKVSINPPKPPIFFQPFYVFSCLFPDNKCPCRGGLLQRPGVNVKMNRLPNLQTLRFNGYSDKRSWRLEPVVKVA